MTRTLELEVLDDWTALLDGEPIAGVGRDSLRTALETVAEQARVDSVSTTVRIRRSSDGYVWTVAAEPDGGIRRLSSAVHEIPVDELKKEKVGDMLADLRGDPSPRRKFLKAGAWILAAGVVVFAGGASIIADNGGESTPAASQSDPDLADLSRPAPTGWTQTVTWQVAPVAEIAPVATGNQVVYVSTDNRVGAVDSATGSQLWLSAPLPFRPDASAVAGGSGDAAFVALRLHDTVAVLPTNSSRSQVVPRLAEIPGARRLLGGPGGILVETPNLSDAVVLSATGEVRHAAVPAGQTALAVSNDGATVVVAPSQGAWSNLPLGAGSATPVAAVTPEEAVGDPHVVSASAGAVVAWWATTDPVVRIVAFHDASTGAVLGSGKTRPEVVDAGLPVVIAADRGHLAAGPVLFNAGTSEVVVSDGWVPSNVAGDLVYGRVDESRAVWHGAGPVETLPAGAAVPWSIASNGMAIVMDRQGELTRLVGVQPR